MNNEYNPNMSIEDTENNNVDENSNDHQFNQYANYHNQFINHQYRNHDSQGGHGQEMNDAQPPSVQPRYQQPLSRRLQNVDEEVELNPLPNLSNNLHRRTLSEDYMRSTSYLPSLPRNNTAAQNREQLLLNPSARNSNRWYSTSHPRPSAEDIRSEGEALLYNFVSEQFREEEIDPTFYFPSIPSFSDPNARQTGRDLRMLADDFARSQERRELKLKAQQVNMASLNCENFFHLLQELFCREKPGITQERIVVLFTFICDVAIQQVRQRAERFISQLMQWSLRFIFEYICAWVQEAGGWGVVLSRSVNLVYNFTKFTLAVFSVVALGVFIKKNWHHL